METFDPKLVVVSFLAQPITGFAEDTFIEAEFNEDAFTLTMGADGTAARSMNANQSGIITITLLHTSPSNRILDAAANLDRLSRTGLGTFLAKSLTGVEQINANNCWVKKKPKIEFGKTVKERVWVLETDSLKLNLGGVGA